MSEEALHARIDHLASQQEIADLVYRYTEFVRDRTESRCAELMTDDAWIELRNGDALEPGASQAHERFVGREEILGSFAKVAGQNAVVVPMVHNLRIEIEGEQARSRCIMASTVYPHGMQFLGEYRDTYRREKGCWRFTSRTFIGLGDLTGKTSQQVHEDWQVIKT